MAFTQRQIRISRAHIPLNRNRRKQVPNVIKTLGDYIQAKRYEKGLHPYQVAVKMGIETALILAWESGIHKPNDNVERPVVVRFWSRFIETSQGSFVGFYTVNKVNKKGLGVMRGSNPTSLPIAAE